MSSEDNKATESNSAAQNVKYSRAERSVHDKKFESRKDPIVWDFLEAVRDTNPGVYEGDRMTYSQLESYLGRKGYEERDVKEVYDYAIGNKLIKKSFLGGDFYISGRGRSKIEGHENKLERIEEAKQARLDESNVDSGGIQQTNAPGEVVKDPKISDEKGPDVASKTTDDTAPGSSYSR